MDLIIAGVIILLVPIYVILLSMCAYIGKVWAIQIMFRRGDMNGKKKEEI